jgi:DNA-binding response OmpR family regulator
MRGRILVVDGTPTARHALRELLEDEGYEVLTAGDGAAALGAAAEFHPHVALLDTSLPDGIGALTDVAPETILMSTQDWRRPSDPDVPCLRKPIDIAQLVAAVAEAMERASTREE